MRQVRARDILAGYRCACFDGNSNWFSRFSPTVLITGT